MQQQWPVATQGANVLVAEYTEMMAVTMKATINNNIEKKMDKDNLSQLTGNNQLATRVA